MELSIPRFAKNHLLLLGLVLGIWAFFSMGTLCVAILSAILIYLFSFNFKELSQRKIIIAICILAISLRFFLAIFHYYFSYSVGKGGDFFGDARAYSSSGQYTAEAVTKRPVLVVDVDDVAWMRILRDSFKGEFPPRGYRIDAFTGYIGLIYSVFGYAPLTLKFINSFLSLFTSILLFLLVKDMFSIKVANVALVLSLFWPSMFLWSISGMKDSLMIFLIVLCTYIFLKLKKYLNLPELLLVLVMLIVNNYAINILLLIGIFLVRILRKFILKRKISINILMPLGLILVMKTVSAYLGLIKLHLLIPLQIAFSLSLIISFLNKKKLVGLLIILFCLRLFSPFYINKYNNLNIKKYFMSFTKEAISGQRSQWQPPARSGYKTYPDRYYEASYREHPNIAITPIEFTISYFKGLNYAILSPFPWSIHSKMSFFAYFQIVAYYILIPFIFLGILVALRYRWQDVLPMVIFMFITGSIFALYEGNVGTVFRHRDALTIFLIVFGAIGVCKFLGHINIHNFTK